MVWNLPSLCKGDYCQKKKSVGFSDAIFKAMMQKEELEPNFEDIVEVRFANSSHGRIAVQELASVHGHTVVPSNNLDLQQFNSSHGRSLHGRKSLHGNNGSLHAKAFVSAHGRIESSKSSPKSSPGSSYQSILATRSADSDTVRVNITPTAAVNLTEVESKTADLQ
jgi:hypothetical protein